MLTIGKFRNRVYQSLEKQSRTEQAEKEADRARQEFLDMISAAKEELRTARDNFNAITDETLLEYYIYEIKAAETKLNYYLNLAKKEKPELQYVSGKPVRWLSG